VNAQTADTETVERLMREVLAGNATRVVFDSSRQNERHAFTLSAIKKVNGQWRADKTEVVQGLLHTQTVEFLKLNAKSTAKIITALAEDNLWQVQFKCHGLACGASYAWSNQVFDNRLLDGVDGLQHYWVWRVGGVWLRAYVIERGNKRVYLQWQIVTPKAPSDNDAITLVTVWREQGFAQIRLEAEAKQLSSRDQEALTLWFEQTHSRRFAVVGHNSDDRMNLEQQQSASLTAAQLQLRLLVENFTPLQFQAFGLGALAPRNGQGNRVEIVPIGPFVESVD
jgi:hypothetical protein